MYQEFNDLVIEHISSCVPKNEVDNTCFDNLMNQKERQFFEKTVGIEKRRYVDKNTTSLDLGFQAAQQLLLNSNISKDQIGAIIFLSQTPDFIIPFSSNILQSQLNLNKEVLCLDINAGCAGFVQGLSICYSIAQSQVNDKKVLFIIGETLSKILSPNDRGTSMLFGDAASALLIGKKPESSRKSYFNFFSDGANSEAIMISHGGFRNMIDREILSVDNNDIVDLIKLKMKGQDVFDFTLREVPNSIKELCDISKVDINQIDRFLFHQSNKFIIKQLSMKLNLDLSKVLLNIEKYGNTSGVSIPLLMSSFRSEFLNTKYVLCSGYGSGLNWGNCIIDISKTKIDEIIIYN